MAIRDPGLCMAIENLKRDRWQVEADIKRVADSIHRHETSLLVLKKAGLRGEVLEACFLLGHCRGSLVPERLEGLRANPLARSCKIRELRSLVERGDREEVPGERWPLVRESLVRALEILENGTPDEPTRHKGCRHAGDHGELVDDLCREGER